MTRNLKGLGLATLAILALGALTAQGALAVEQEFRSDGAWTIGTGEAALKLTVGAVGTVECTGEFEDQSGGSKVLGKEEWVNDTLTVTPRFKECTFGGQPATVFVNHCAFVVESDLTKGNPTNEEEFANAEIECAEGHKLEIDTVQCTVTVGPQLVKHAINYPEDTAFSMAGNIAAHNVVLGKARTTAAQPLNGCLPFPTGAVGKLTGNGTTACFKDEGSVLTGTEKTTPQTKTTEGGTTECSIG